MLSNGDRYQKQVADHKVNWRVAKQIVIEMNVIMTCQARRLKHDDYHLQDLYQNPKGHGMNEKQYNWRNLACRQSMTVLVRSFVCTKNEKKNNCKQHNTSKEPLRRRWEELKVLYANLEVQDWHGFPYYYYNSVTKLKSLTGYRLFITKVIFTGV